MNRLYLQLYKVVILCLCGLVLWAAPAFALSSQSIISAKSKYVPGSEVKEQVSVTTTTRMGCINTLSKKKPSSTSRHTAAKLSSTKYIAAKLSPPRYTVAKLSPTRLRRKLSSRSAIVMDAKTGQIIYSHAPDRLGQPASTIKVLTGLIAMKSLSDSTTVSVSRKASKMPRSKIYLRKGRQYKANDLINAVLLSSANDASVALAEKIAGSELVFTKLMNRKAKELGATTTVCKSATGLTVRGQRSSVRDLATIFNGAMADPEFAKRIGRVKTKTSYGKTLSNHNKALWRIDGAKGGKTGYTYAARQTYVGRFSRHGVDLTVAVMGSETMWDDIARLVEFGFAQNQYLASQRLHSPATTVVARY
ncbi:MAG: D-alanyl-D-alanine carboxypeptidase [Desulfobulbaceae bacterium]|nr:D-alanyl-D-alanine carboxypeptidase [Desulfobulbaceae bacterium]